MSIASEITRLQNAKSSIKTSIEEKGVTVPSETTLDGFSLLIDQIVQGGGSLPETIKVKTFELANDGSSDSTQIFTHNFGEVPKAWVLMYSDSSKIIGQKAYAWLLGIQSITQQIGTGYNNVRRTVSNGYSVSEDENAITIATKSSYRFVAGTYYLFAI